MTGLSMTDRNLRVGLRVKLIRVFAFQVLMISVAALIGVGITYVIVQDVLTRQALSEEAQHFWHLLDTNPEQPLPNTANMVGYLSDRSDVIPAGLRELPEGFGRVSALPDDPLIHVSRKEDRFLYLVFSEEQVSSLVFLFGLAPLAAVLLTVYVVMFLTYRLSHRAISPMLNLAAALERFDFRSAGKLTIPVQPDDVDRETRLMVEALGEFSERLEKFIERERTFTRNAGHELRTPIAVLKGSMELLNSRVNPDSGDREVYDRMNRVVNDMEVLLETLLLLAREEDVTAEVPTNVNQIVTEEIELLSQLAGENGNHIDLVQDAELYCRAKPKVLAIIVSNLLRNALTYTKNGRVTVELSEDKIRVSDTGLGMTKEELEEAFTAFYRGERAERTTEGQGLGLALVRRLSQQLGWRVEAASEAGEGSVFTLYYQGVV